MSVTIGDSIKRWTAKRKTALVVEIIQGKTTVAEASRAYDLSPSEIEGWVDDAKRRMENALRANPLEIREQYEKQLKDLGDKLSDEQKKPVEAAIEKVREALKGDDKAQIEAKSKPLEEAAQALFAAAAAAQQPAGDAGQPGGNASGAPKGDDVVDAEFTEVKDDGEKP